MCLKRAVGMDLLFSGRGNSRLDIKAAARAEMVYDRQPIW